MKWRKPDPQPVALLCELVPEEPAVDLRPVLGTPAYFVGGNDLRPLKSVHSEVRVFRPNVAGQLTHVYGAAQPLVASASRRQSPENAW